MLDLVRERQSEIEEVCRRFRVKRLELFGSAASGRFRPGESDLDFLVEFQPPFGQGYADRYFGLLEALEALFRTKVDLLIGSALENPYFIREIERGKILLYAA